MEDKKRDIYQRKQLVQSQMASQTIPTQQPGISPGQPGIAPNQVTGMPPSQVTGMPPNQVTGMPPNQVTGMPPNQVTGMPPNQVTGMPPNQVTGMPSNQVTGRPPNQVTGMPPNQVTGMSPNQVTGMSPNQVTGMPPSQLPKRSNQQGMPPHHQGMPPSSQGMSALQSNQDTTQQNQGQMRMGEKRGMEQNNQGMRMSGPGGFNKQQRIGVSQSENIGMHSQQHMRMGGSGQQNEGDDSHEMMDQTVSDFGRSRPRFQGGPRFNQQQSPMNRMPGPRSQFMRGQRPPLGQDDKFRRPGIYGQVDSFSGEGGEEDMCLEDESENSSNSNQIENAFLHSDTQQGTEGEYEEDENEEMMAENMHMGGDHQLRGMHNMHMRGHPQNMHMRGGAQNMQMRGGAQNMHMRGGAQNMHMRGGAQNRFIRGASQNNQMRGNFQNVGTPGGMGGPRGQMFNQSESQTKQFGNIPPRMPTRGPISLMDIRFDKPPKPLNQNDVNKPDELENQAEDEQNLDTTDKGYD